MYPDLKVVEVLKEKMDQLDQKVKKVPLDLLDQKANKDQQNVLGLPTYRGAGRGRISRTFWSAGPPGAQGLPRLAGPLGPQEPQETRGVA